MASYQRIALFVIFNSIERDLINNIRQLIPPSYEQLLTEDEVKSSPGSHQKARPRQPL